MTYHFLLQVSWVEGCPVRPLDTPLLLDKKNCSHSHSGWTTKTVIWNMKKLLHVILVHLAIHLATASIKNGGWK